MKQGEIKYTHLQSARTSSFKGLQGPALQITGNVLRSPGFSSVLYDIILKVGGGSPSKNWSLLLLVLMVCKVENIVKDQS